MNKSSSKFKIITYVPFFVSLLNCILNCIIDTSRFSFTDPVNKINKLANNYYDGIEFFLSQVELISC